MPAGMQATPLPSSLVEHALFGQGPGSLCRASGPCATSTGIIPTVELGSPDVTQSDSSIARAAIHTPSDFYSHHGHGDLSHRGCHVTEMSPHG